MTAKHTGCIGPGCPLCPLLGRPEYASVYEMLTGLKASDNQPRERCRHLGQPTGRTIECGSCPQGKTRMKEFACGKYTTCTLGVTTPAQHGCIACPSYERYGLRIFGCWGIGDWMTLESMFADDERQQLTEAYIACPQAIKIRELWQLLPGYPRLKQIHAIPTPGIAYQDKDRTVKAGIPIPPDAIDYSNYRFLPHPDRYRGSTIATTTLCQAPIPAGQYVTVVPWSHGHGGYTGRAFSQADWTTLDSWLTARQLTGVLVTWPAHPHPACRRILDWGGKLSLAQSIEVLKHGLGYVGIDSCLSVIAAKLFPASRLAIRTISEYTRSWLSSYYAPHTDFSFVRPVLVPPSWDDTGVSTRSARLVRQ